MASLSSWLSPAMLGEPVMRALGWALIHSLWQCLAIAALAAALMAFSRRPSLRYVIATGALAVMLAAPAATFLVLTRPAAPLEAATTSALPAAAPQIPFAVIQSAQPAPAIGTGMAGALNPAPHLTPALLSWLVTAWLLGVACFSLRFAGGFLLLEHKRRRQSTAPGPRVMALCLDLQRQLGLTRAVRYLECSWLQTPAVIGWLRPVVLLPVTALIGLSEAQLRAVIAHELAHIRRLDAFVNLFQILVEALLFYHPAVWWLNRRIRAERELCCDEIALSVAGDRLDYARALTLMAQWERAPALAMAANRGPLTERVFYVLGHNAPGAGQRMIGLTGSMLFLLAALAAANALFVVAAPPMTQAREKIRLALSSVQGVGDQALRQAIAAITPPRIEESADPQADAAQSGSLAAPLAAPLAPPRELPPLPLPALTTPVIMASRAPIPGDAALPAGVTRPVASNEPATLYRCHNSSVFGQVISPKIIQMQGFICALTIGPGAGTAEGPRYGACPNASSDPVRATRLCKYDVIMNVLLADPADAARMQPGKIVRLSGNFRAARESQVDYLRVENAKVIWVDPFDRSVAQPAVAPNAQPVAPPATVLASLNAAAPPGAYRCRTSKVFALVISPEQIQLPGFVCLPGDKESFSPIKFGSCPLASSDLFDRQKGCKFDVTMKMQLASYGDAFKMKRRALVRLSGDVRLTRDGQGIVQGDSLVMENARLLQADPFGVAQSAFRCMPSELDAFAKRIGRRLCVQRDIMTNLAVTGAALQAAATTPLREPDVNGSAGDPEAITCRLPEDKKPAAHLRPLPLNCAYNSLWARVRYLPPQNVPMGAPNFSQPPTFFSGTNDSGGQGNHMTAHGNGPNGPMP